MRWYSFFAPRLPPYRLAIGRASKVATMRHEQQADHAERVDALRVPLAPVRVLLGRADQHRHHDRGEHAAKHQVVDGVGQRVGRVVGVGGGVEAERVHEHERAQEPGRPGRQRAERHRLARPGEVGRGVLGEPLRPGGRNLADVGLEDPRAVVLDIGRRAALGGHEPRRRPGRRLREVERLEGRLRVARGHRRQERRRCRGGALPAAGRRVPLARRERRPRLAAGLPVPRPAGGPPALVRRAGAGCGRAGAGCGG